MRSFLLRFFAAILTFWGISFASNQVVSAQNENPLPNLSGAKAIDFLKQTGEYEAFSEAVEKAIYGADDLIQQRKLLASDGTADDRFGNSVAISGDRILIGSYTANVGGSANRGAAYVFVRNGVNWTQEAKITAFDGAAEDLFGFAVSLDGVKAVISSYRDDETGGVDQGSAYVFEYFGNQWLFRKKLLAADGAGDDRFGSDVKIVSNQIFVGAAGDDFGTVANQGSIYVFSGSGTYPQLAKLTTGDPAADDVFGSSLDYKGNTLVVGAPGDDGPNGVPLNQGAVHVFTGANSGWAFQARLTQTDPGQNDQLGRSVAISGNTIISGAPLKNSEQGAAYIFTNNGAAWSQTIKLLPAGVGAFHRFGFSTAINGNRAFVGAQSATVGGNANQGAVYTFGFNTGSWVQRDKLTAADGAVNDIFGTSLAVWRNTLIIGASDDTVGTNVRQGSVYVYPAEPAKFDFQGDGKADLAVFRPSSGVWHLSSSVNGNYTPIRFGLNGDKPMPSDYDGDGITDLAVFRPSNGTWYWINSSNNSISILSWGLNGDIPMPGFFRDGDFRAEPTVFRPSEGTWYIFRSNGSGYTIIRWGLPGDIPMVGDFFGEGLDNLAVYRPSNGVWYLRQSNGEMTAFQFGLRQDKPVPADYNGDGKTDAAVFRPSNGIWYILNDDGSYGSVQWGISSDIPLAADFDGDGIDNIAVFRPSNGAWYIRNNDGSYSVSVFGISEDKPIPAAYVRE